MFNFINNYLKINKLEIKDKTISLFHDIYIVEDDFKNKKLIKYVKGKRRPKKAIKDVYLALLKISHKNIISIYDVIESDDDFFVIMEYFDGINLNQYIKREFYPSEKPNLDNLKNIFENIAKSIDFINSKGIIHTDIIGHNILINKNLEIKIIDFDFAILDNDSILNSDIYSFLVMFYQFINEYIYLNDKYNLYEYIYKFNEESKILDYSSCSTFLKSTKIFN